MCQAVDAPLSWVYTTGITPRITGAQGGSGQVGNKMKLRISHLDKDASEPIVLLHDDDCIEQGSRRMTGVASTGPPDRPRPW
jgi:hypothetical protein